MALAACFPFTTFGNPLDPNVVAGGASFQTQGNALTVTNAPGTVINWQSFSIGQNEVTRFVQQSAASQVLNRVVGGDPSQILGALQSNGQVFLINPNGIAFGPGAQVDVAGLVASTLNISNADFLSGRLSFTAGGAAGNIRNDGTLRALDGGSIYLIAPSIENNGVVSAPDGSIVLAAGKTATLMDSNRPYVQVEITAGGEAVNVGQLVASGVGIYAGTIRAGGTVDATRAVVDESGHVRFMASGDTTIASDAVVTANGATGGEVRVESGGTTWVEGSVSAQGTTGTGGRIILSGAQVGLREHGVVDASGATGGGSVYIGGGPRGHDSSAPNALRAYIAPGAIVRADALTRGNGGTVVVWSDEFSAVHGRVAARGGAFGGNGGFIETSGGSLAISATPDVTAPAGSGGTWLIDPNNIAIVAGVGVATGIGDANPFLSTADGAQLGVDLIRTALTGGANVTITTGAGGTQAGDIVWNAGAPLDYNGHGANTLTLSAHNNIALNSSITDSNAATADRLNLTLAPDSDAAGGGAVSVASSIVLDLRGGVLQVNGGGITFGNGSTLSNATLQAGVVTLNNGSIFFNGVTLATDFTVPAGAV
ncbi:MAG: filamentous hemagglutinin N-terminal domain-containing protein, partial [Betaproteobacteria bacterium]